MTNVNQAPLPRLSKRRWYGLRLLSGAISTTGLYPFLPLLFAVNSCLGAKATEFCKKKTFIMNCVDVTNLGAPCSRPTDTPIRIEVYCTGRGPYK